MRPRRRIFDRDKEDELRTFWEGSEPLHVLAKRWGCSVPYISVKAKTLGLPTRLARVQRVRHGIVVTTLVNMGSAKRRRYFEAEAHRRGMTRGDLEAALLKIISNERLIDAIMDDREELELRVAS